MALLAGRNLRRQPLRAAVAALAVAAGVSLAVGVAAAHSSASGSVVRFSTDLAGPATLRIGGASSGGGLDHSVVERVEGIDGVAAVVPLVFTATVAEDGSGRQIPVVALGADCRIEALLGPMGCEPALFDQAAPDRPLLSPALAAALGPEGVVRSEVGRLPVTGAVEAPFLAGINDDRLVVYGLAAAQSSFARDGSLDLAYVVPDGRVPAERLEADVAAAAGEWNLVGPAVGGFRGSDTFAPVVAGLAVIGLVALAIGGQLVVSTISLGLAERRTELATIAAVGGGTGAVAAVVLAEAAVLGLAGGLAGTAGGALVSRPLLSDLEAMVAQAGGLQLSSSLPPWLVLMGVGLGVGLALVAAVRPARAAARMELSHELSAAAQRVEAEAALRPGRRWLLLAVAAAGIGLAVVGGRKGSLQPWQPAVAYLGVVLALVAVTRAGSAWTPVLVARALRPRPSTPASVAVAASSLVREPGRTSAMATAVIGAVTMGVILANFGVGMTTAASRMARAEAAGKVVVTTLPVDNAGFVAAGPSPALRTALARVPGVAAVEETVFLEVEHPTAGDVGVSEAEPSRLPGHEVFAGPDAAAALAAGRVLVGPALARTLDLRPGDELVLPGRHGMATLTVGAVWGSPTNQGSSVALPVAAIEEIWGPRPPRWLLATPEAGVGVDELAQRIEAADLDPDVGVYTPDELARSFAGVWSEYLQPFWALQRAVVLVAVVAVASTLLLVGVQRRHEQGVLAAVGMGPGRLARLTVLEAGIVAVAGTVVAVVAAAAMQAALNPLSALATGLAVPFRFDPVAPAVFGVLTLAAILAGSAVPAWRTSRLEVVEALRYE